MSDVFISYAREDKPKAELLAQALGREGFSVWWDRKIPPGKSYGEVIEQALNSAKCIIVLWSKKSIASHWVKDEAAEGVKREILIPAMIEDVIAPLGFRQFQIADLTGWKGDSAHPELQELLDAVRVQLGLDRHGTEPVPPPANEEAQPPPVPVPHEPQRGAIYNRPVPRPSTIQEETSVPEMVPGSIFLSYASEDAVAVQKIRVALEAVGLDVWFDKRQLEWGDDFGAKIKRYIRACSFFAPVISASTEKRSEGYFRLEWRLAVEIAMQIAEGVPFIVPIALDETNEWEAQVPDKFKEVQWARLTRDGALSELTKNLVKLVREYRKRERM